MRNYLEQAGTTEGVQVWREAIHGERVAESASSGMARTIVSGLAARSALVRYTRFAHCALHGQETTRAVCLRGAQRWTP